MLETTNVLVNKLSMRIVRSQQTSSDSDVGSIILRVLYKQICELSDAVLEWRAFSRGGIFATSDSSTRGISAYTQSNDGILWWASNLYVKDCGYLRRRWKYYFAIKQTSEGEAMFYYAKCRYDHLAGSIIPAKTCSYARDTIPDPLFYDSEIRCMAGNYPFPTGAAELNDASLSELIDLLFDNQRRVPVMLITCPDVITPEIMADMTLGNMIVYWCQNSALILRLNASVPRELRTPWDTVHIFMPLTNVNSFHPCYSYEEIHRMGMDSFFAGIRQAYCENMYSEERRSFITVEEVMRMRDREHIQQLEALNNEQSRQLADTKAQLDRQALSLKSAQEQIDTLTQHAEEIEATEWESLLAESMAEADALKQGISALSTNLYSTMGIGYKPDPTERIPLIHELSNAIYASLRCAKERQ